MEYPHHHRHHSEALQTAIDMHVRNLPYVLESIKAVNELTHTEFKEFNKVMRDQPLNALIEQEMIKTRFIHPTGINVSEGLRTEFDDILHKKFGNTDLRTVVKDIMDDPLYRNFNPHENPQEAFKIVMSKLFEKIFSDAHLMRSITGAIVNSQDLSTDYQNMEKDINSIMGSRDSGSSGGNTGTNSGNTGAG